MNRIVDTCPLTKFERGLNLLHEADDDAVIWLESTATEALAKYVNNENIFMLRTNCHFLLSSLLLHVMLIVTCWVVYCVCCARLAPV